MSWRGELTISVLGFAGVSLGKYELKRLGEKKIPTVNVCPECNVVPDHIEAEAKYECPNCHQRFKSYYGLRRAVKSGNDIVLLPDRQAERTKKASLKLLDLAEVRGLVTRAEFAILPAGEQENANLQKLGNMLKRYKKVALFKLVFRKGAEAHLCYVTVADDGMIMVRGVGNTRSNFLSPPTKEIVPLNLVEPLPFGVVFADQEVEEKEVEELMQGMPKATEEDLNIKDEVIEALAKTPETEDLAKMIKKVMIKKSS